MDRYQLDHIIDKCLNEYFGSSISSSYLKSCDRSCCLGARFADAIPAADNEIRANPHCRQSILNRGYKSLKRTFFQRILQHDSPRLPYTPVPRNFIKTVIHWGQRKLLMSEIEFLTLIGPTKLHNSVVVYAGAAPGTHTPYLITLFPQVDKWILVDPAAFNDELQGNPKVETIGTIFTDTLAARLREQYHNKSIYFISDIRTADPSMHNNVEIERRVLSDMIAQSTWHSILKSRRSMLKFRLPWNIGPQSMPPTLEYLAGDVYLPVWGPPSTTESRLITHEWNGDGRAPTQVYNNEEYEQQMFYFNRILRPSLYDHPIVGEGIDHCYDCRAELEILRKYISNFNPGQDIVGMSMYISRHIPPGNRTLADPNLDEDQRRQNIERRQFRDGKPAYEAP